MRMRLPAAAVFTILLGLFTLSCADPPDKEMQQAQGALDAARAAGADQYAADEYKAAALALEKSHEAVTQRDYRLALSQALDSRERAQNAARMAADEKAAVRVEAERLLAALATEVDACAGKLKVAQSARLPAKALAPAQQQLAGSRTAMQKAREAIDRRDYLAARSALAGIAESLAKGREEIEAAIEQRQPAASRRRK
jgi:hypothetical protein